jgi:pimeloyl-ACP methyl ester carboxylesterase
MLEASTSEGTFRYIEAGDSARGQPLLLIHCLGGSSRLWAESLPLFADLGYWAVAPDILSHGMSDKPPYFGYGIRDHARSLVLFMKEVGMRDPYVVGTSLGAQIAIELCAGYPKMVHKVVLNGCPGWELEEQRMSRIQMIARSVLDEEARPAVQPGAPAVTDDDEVMVMPPSEDMQRAGAWFWDTAWATAAYNLHSRLPFITTPALVLMGERDWHLPTSYTIAHKIRTSTMEVLPAPIGHLSPEDDTPAVVRSCHRFFETNLEDPLDDPSSPPRSDS